MYFVVNLIHFRKHHFGLNLGVWQIEIILSLNRFLKITTTLVIMNG